LSLFKRLAKQTAIYGLATVLPRVLSIILVPLYVVVLGTEQYGVYASLMAFLILGNVLLSYGMETAFFRFLNKHSSQKKIVQSTAMLTLMSSTILFLIIALMSRDWIANYLQFKPIHILYAILILGLDALVVIPFAWYRANEKPGIYTVIKICNVVLNLSLNVFFFLWLLPRAEANPKAWWVVESPVSYVFIANIIASAFSFLATLPVVFKIGYSFSYSILKKMLKYAIPVLIAGIAFSINEAFDKILLKYLLPSDIAETEVGIYAACYKLGVFMTLFATAFRLGIEPFFFTHASHKNAKENYAIITKYFTIIGSCIVIIVVVYIDLFKMLLIPNPTFWEALKVVPLILVANLCLGIYHNLSVWYKVTDRTKYGAYISILGAIITLSVNFALIPILGYMGSAIATLAAYGSMMLLSYYLGKHFYGVPYQTKKISAYLLASIVISGLSFYIFDRNLIVGSLLALAYFVALVFFEKKELLQYFRNESKSN